MMPLTSGPTRISRKDALTIWAAARERAADELTLKADRMTREAHGDAARWRTAARLLRQRAVKERAQAAACRADKTDGPRVTGAAVKPPGPTISAPKAPANAVIWAAVAVSEFITSRGRPPR